MKKSISVFGSKAERKAFSTIEAHLPEGFGLYHNLPLSQIVDVERGELSVGDWDFYLKTSVDFIVADRSDEPVLAIEFDGMAGGFSYGSKYQPAREPGDQNRSKKLDFKLDLCGRVGFPLYVISFDEVDTLGGDESLRIVHGIVAQELVRMDMADKLRQWDKNERGHGKTWNEMLMDMAKAETELQHKYDPFRAGLEPMWADFIKLKSQWSLEPISRPSIFDAPKRIDAVGCKFTARGVLAVPVILTVWVRNFAGDALGLTLSSDVSIPNAVNPLRVAENIAWYLGIKKTLEANGASL